LNNWIKQHPFSSFYIPALVIGVLAFGVIFAGGPGADALKTYVTLLLGLMAMLIVLETLIVARYDDSLIANVISVYGLDSLLTFFEELGLHKDGLGKNV